MACKEEGMCRITVSHTTNSTSCQAAGSLYGLPPPGHRQWHLQQAVLCMLSATQATQLQSLNQLNFITWCTTMTHLATSSMPLQHLLHALPLPAAHHSSPILSG